MTGWVQLAWEMTAIASKASTTKVGEVTRHPLPLKRLRVVPRRIGGSSIGKAGAGQSARRGRHGMRFVAQRILKSAGGTRNRSRSSALTAQSVGHGLGL